jgi:anthranilate phosphoribosyltransferase
MTERINRDEARQILEKLARTGPPSAQVAAIRLLLRLEKEREEQAAEGPTAFEDL